MPQFEFRPAFQRTNDTLAQELYPDIFTPSPAPPTAAIPGRTPPPLKPVLPVDIDKPRMSETIQPADTAKASPVKMALPGQKDKPLVARTEQPPGLARTRLVQTDALVAPASGSSQEKADPLSLITALQSTMAQPKKRLLVIPGSRKRERRLQKNNDVKLSLHPHLRIGIVLPALLLILLLSLLIFTPLSSATSQLPFLNSVISWVHTQQINWSAIGQDTVAPQTNPVAPLPPVTLPMSQYVAIARQDAINAGIPPDYFVRQINLESGFNPNAVSPSGAVGIAQFLPSTARGLGVNPNDPISALQGAALYMANYARQYGGDYAKALAAYNAGSGTVNNAIRVGGANWLNFLPAETRNYIHVIMGI